MKYKTHRTNDTRQCYNAWQLATKGGKLKRVSISKYRNAYKVAFYLNWLNDFSDKVANYDNDETRYNEKTSERLNKRLSYLQDQTLELLNGLGLDFFLYSHFYNVKDIETGKEVFIKI